MNNANRPHHGGIRLHTFQSSSPSSIIARHPRGLMALTSLHTKRINNDEVIRREQRSARGTRRIASAVS